MNYFHKKTQTNSLLNPKLPHSPLLLPISVVLPPHSYQTPPPTQIRLGFSYISQMSYIAVNSLKIKRSSTGYQEMENDECIFNFNHKTSHMFHTSHNITTMVTKYI